MVGFLRRLDQRVFGQWLFINRRPSPAAARRAQILFAAGLVVGLGEAVLEHMKAPQYIWAALGAGAAALMGAGVLVLLRGSKDG
ncbi:MAG TPA: hypothetical protein VLR26_03135 [Frankiaceae bacterium]|nr:hypothetical protein [Frankiaceae bacterium]